MTLRQIHLPHLTKNIQQENKNSTKKKLKNNTEKRKYIYILNVFFKLQKNKYIKDLLILIFYLIHK